MGRVREEVITNVIQFISWEEVAACGDLQAVNSTYYGVTTIWYGVLYLIRYEVPSFPIPPFPLSPLPAWVGPLLGCFSFGCGELESPELSCGAAHGSRVLTVPLSGQRGVCILVGQEHQGRQSGVAGTDSSWGAVCVCVCVCVYVCVCMVRTCVC